MKVRATRLGYFGSVRKRPGDVFEVDEKQFSPLWMQRLDGRKEAEPSPEVKGKGKRGKEADGAKSSGDTEVI